jgi:hypothetical protein
VARNPARAAFYNRATGGTAYGDKPAPGQHGLELFNPTADLGRAIGDPGSYVRGTLATPVQGLVTLGQEALGGDMGASLKTTGQELTELPGALAHGSLPNPKKSKYADSVRLRAERYMTYGNPVDLRWLLSAAASGVPEARDMLTELGLGQFKAKPGTVLERAGKLGLQQSTGIAIK